MLHQDAHWPRAGHWLAGSYAEKAQVGELAVLGVPLNKSVTPGRCDLAPDAIRHALLRYSTADLDLGLDLLDLLVQDLGNLSVGAMSPEASLEPTIAAMSEALDSAAAIALLGGDNGVTRPGVHGLAQALGLPLARIGVITLDAHFDLRETTHGLHNGNPIRALLEDGLPGDQIAQVGIQSFANSPDYAQVGREAGIHLILADEVHEKGMAWAIDAAFKSIENEVEAIYLDFDLDVMDRAFVPGTPGSRPGGLTPSMARFAARYAGRHPKVKAIDFVEMDPTQDHNDLTSLAAGACFLSFASGLLARLKA